MTLEPDAPDKQEASGSSEAASLGDAADEALEPANATPSLLEPAEAAVSQSADVVADPTAAYEPAAEGFEADEPTGADEPVATGPDDEPAAALEDDAERPDAVESPADGGIASELPSVDAPPAEGEVAPVTAADVPGLAGCDVEKAWTADEICADTDPEAASTIEAAAVPVEVAEEVAADQEGARSLTSVPSWPFLAYFGVWVLLAVIAGYFLEQVPDGTPLYETDLYGYTVLGGLVLTAAGPLLILAVWLATWWRRRGSSRVGLLSSALLKGALATFAGVVVWWAMLIIVDTMRLGRPM